MGAKLMHAVLNEWAPYVSERGFRTLMRMAATARDEATKDMPANLYFAGREPLLNTWRIESRKGSEKTANKELQRVLNELVRVGAIERTNKAYVGTNQVYRLTLTNRPRIDARAVDNLIDEDGKGGRTAPPVTGPQTPPVEGRTAEKWGGVQPPPIDDEGLTEGQEVGMEAADLRGPVTLRAREPNEDGFIPPVECGYKGCVRGWVIPTDPLADNEPCPKCSPNVVVFRRTG